MALFPYSLIILLKKCILLPNIRVNYLNDNSRQISKDRLV